MAPRLSLIVLFLFLSISFTDSARSRLIELRAKTVNTATTQSLLHDSVKRDSMRSYTETALYIIQARERVTPHFRAAIADVLSPSAVLHYIPSDSLLVRTSLAALEALRKIPEVHWAGPYETDYKLSSTLQEMRNDDSRDSKGRLHYFPNVIIAMVAPECEDWEAEDSCMNTTVIRFERDAFYARKARRYSLTLRATSNTTIHFGCGPTYLDKCLDFLVDWLPHRHEVLWLEASPISYTANRHAVPTLFTDAQPYPTIETLRSNNPATFGQLRGQGQIVGIADTGVDLTSCFFSDTEPVGPTHRKVLAYNAFANGADIAQGHGTAAAGCFVGNCVADGTIAQYNGVAPDAKLVFFDISNTTQDPLIDYGGQVLELPDDLTTIYKYVYDLGVRVHSDSWGGTPLSEPSGSTQTLDQYLWDHPDFLNVRAAGNDGTRYYSIATQASAKNVLTIGALDTTLEAYLETVDYYDLSADMFYFKNRYCPFNTSVCNMTEADCCTSTIALVKSTCCRATIKDVAVANTLIYNTSVVASFSSKGPTRDQRVKPDVMAVGNRVITALAKGTTSYTAAPSAGPLTDTSLAANVFTISGTSFSAPLTAGAATIVRQYFTDGFYPTGRLGNPSKLPSAALIKAMLIAGAQPAIAFTNSTSAPWPIPTGDEVPLGEATWEAGFGRVVLDRILYFDGVSDFNILVFEGEVVTNETASLCFELPSSFCKVNTTSPQHVSATLVWTDYPAFASSVRQLVNDLDLVFVRSDKSGSERVYYGNRPFDTTGLDSTPDTLNNVERVTANITQCPATFRVNVSGINVPGSCDGKGRNCKPQRFAVVVKGPIGMTLAPKCVECESGNSPLSCAVDHGVGEKRCKNGKYTKCFVSNCNKGYTINSYNNKCRAFLSYYVVVGIASGIFILMTALICIPIELLYHCRRRSNSGARSASDLNKVGFWDVFEVIEPRLFSMVVGSVCSLIGTSCSLIQPLFIADLFEQLQTATTFGKIVSLFYLIILFVVLEFIFSALGDLIIGVGTEGLLRHLRDRLYDGIIHRNYSELEGLDKGELRSRVMLDPQLVITFPSTALVVIFSGLVKIVVGGILIFLISWSLSLVFLAVVPFLAVIAIVYAWLIQPRITEQLDLLNATSAIAHEGFSNLRVVKMYHKEDDETWRFVAANERYYARAMRNIVLNDGANTIKSFLMQALAVGLLWYGSVLVIRPEITSGLLLAFFLYVGLAAAGVLSFSGVWPSYTTTLGALTRILELADQLNLAKARERAAEKDTTFTRIKKLVHQTTAKSIRATHRDPDRTTGAIGMDKVSFKYATFSDQWILKDLSMKFDIGKSHAIIGPSGAGKTSVFNLLTRLYEPNSGSIQLDGQDIAGLSQEELLRYVGVVEQAPRVFHRSVWDNITYSKSGATAEEVDEVCRLTNCSEFISKMPNGYDTVIGEDSGEVLSGGQKQRLTLARALLKNPRVLLLDEPTSELDVENAQMITDLIMETAKDRTVIFITHSLATCRKADTIFFLQAGEVMESGSHDELMAKRGSYFNFIQISFAMAAEGEDPNLDKKTKRAGRILDLPNSSSAPHEDIVTAQLLLATSPRFTQMASSSNFAKQVEEIDRIETETERAKQKERRESAAGTSLQTPKLSVTGPPPTGVRPSASRERDHAAPGSLKPPSRDRHGSPAGGSPVTARRGGKDEKEKERRDDRHHHSGSRTDRGDDKDRHHRSGGSRVSPHASGSRSDRRERDDRKERTTTKLTTEQELDEVPGSD